VPIPSLQGDPCVPFGAFLLSANEIFLKLTNFIHTKQKKMGKCLFDEMKMTNAQVTYRPVIVNQKP
jgi:hypothetical protein